MTAAHAAGFNEAIRCVLAETQQWRKLAGEHQDHERKDEMLICMAVTDALIMLAENMTRALKRTMEDAGIDVPR